MARSAGEVAETRAGEPQELLNRTRPQQLQAGAEAIFAETGAGSDLAR